MKLDAKAIRYLTSEDFRVLAAVLIGPSWVYPAIFFLWGYSIAHSSLANM